jgi:hypothetical protein
MPSVLTVVVRMAVLALPACLLLIACLRATGGQARLLWLGAAFQILLCCLLLLNQRSWQQPAGPPVIILYLIALSWLWLVAGSSEEWYPQLARAVLLVVPLLVFAVQTLRDSGALAYRRARILCERLAQRTTWPASLGDCGTLPEVKALREALVLDATPALALLKHERKELRVAALAALEFRKFWKRSQAEMVLHMAQRASEPMVRATAIMALGNVDDQSYVEALAEFLRDPAWEVRRAAMEAVLWDTESRWPWVRHVVRRSLSDPLFQADGALRHGGQLLTDEAVADLTAWSAEKGCLGERAALTLGSHYNRALSANPTPELFAYLKHRVADPHMGAALRLEVALLLREYGELDRKQVNDLLAPVNPAPLRLMAADSLLAEGTHSEALATLRDVARLPNRELALTTAAVVQRRLGVDLGLALGEALPPLHSRLAAEVTRRVMTWAMQNDVERSPVPWTAAPPSRVET